MVFLNAQTSRHRHMCILATASLAQRVTETHDLHEVARRSLIIFRRTRVSLAALAVCLASASLAQRVAETHDLHEVARR